MNINLDVLFVNNTLRQPPADSLILSGNSKGQKKVDGKPSEKVESDWKFAPDYGYTTFESGESVMWMDLVIEVKRP